MKIRHLFNKKKGEQTIVGEIIDDAEEITETVAANIDLITGTILSVFFSAIMGIVTAPRTEGGAIDWGILGMVTEFIITPFIMLVIFKIVTEKTDKRFQRIRNGYRECMKNLRKSNNEKDRMIYEHEATIEQNENVHKLEMAKLRYQKDIELAQLNTVIKTKQSEIDFKSEENRLLCTKLQMEKK